jgi:cell division protein FtsI/penicillin-binding protein 2
MFIFLLVCTAMLGLLARLYYWQIMESQDGFKLAQIADAQHNKKNQVVNAPRGLIYDINGRILATNVVRDDVYIMPIQFGDDHKNDPKAETALNDLVAKLHQVLPDLSEDDLRARFKLGQAAVKIASAITPEQSKKLHDMHLSDVFLDARTIRIYPGGDLASQIMGFVSLNGAGVYGIEEQFNKLLSGKPGSFSAETDLNGNPLTVGSSSSQPPVNGASLQLTIDGTIQYIAQAALIETVKQQKAQSGSVIVVNARTGAIVAMAGAPSFDPNSYGNYAKEKGCLGAQEVYFNPVLYCAYEPGSTMKAITMAAGLDQGVITPDTTINDQGCITFKNIPRVCNWKNQPYGQETMTQVMEHSANVGSAWVAYEKLGPDRYYPYLERFGFGQATNVGGQEATGSYPSNKDQNWSPSDLTRQAFGQTILATPLQVAMAYQALANGGVLMKPYLIASIHDNGHVIETKPQVQQRVISTQAAQQVTGMLKRSASDGFAKPATFPGYSIAAKTGTATTQGLEMDQTEASVAGFLPASNPQFVILVKIDRPQAIYGADAAAPLWRQIAQQLMWRYNIPPDQA